MKHQRQLEEARATSAAAIKELEQLQNEKRKMLMEHETQKLRELDDAYGQELREWKAQLKQRKQVNYTYILIFKYVNSIRSCEVLS
jgi:STE20-like kinase